MVRRRPPHRFAQILDAALVVFSRQGFRRTQMSDIAKEAGVAPGTLYTYVESKEALFALVLARANDPAAPLPTELPVPAPTGDELTAAIGEGVRWQDRLPALHAALRRTRVTDVRAELDAVIGELWELFADTREVADLLERSARDWPDLAIVFYAGLRGTLLADLASYVDKRARRGHFAPSDHPDVVARFIIESVVWFARHRHHDRDIDIPDDVARAVVVPLVVRALLP